MFAWRSVGGYPALMVASEVVHGGAPLVETEDGCHHSVHEPESQQGGAMRPPSHFYRLSSSNAVVNPYYHRIEGRKQSRSSLVMSAAAGMVSAVGTMPDGGLDRLQAAQRVQKGYSCNRWPALVESALFILMCLLYVAMHVYAKKLFPYSTPIADHRDVVMGEPVHKAQAVRPLVVAPDHLSIAPRPLPVLWVPKGSKTALRLRAPGLATWAHCWQKSGSGGAIRRP